VTVALLDGEVLIADRYKLFKGEDSAQPSFNTPLSWQVFPTAYPRATGLPLDKPLPQPFSG
jgi:hypothetical protein